LSKTEKENNDKKRIPEGYVIIIGGRAARAFLDDLHKRYKKKNIELVPMKHPYPHPTE